MFSSAAHDERASYPAAAGSRVRLLDGRPGNPVERRRDSGGGGGGVVVGDEPHGGGRGDRVRA